MFAARPRERPRAFASVRERSRAFATVRDCPRVSSRRCAVGIGEEKYIAGLVVWSFRVASVGHCGHVGVALDRVLAFRVASVGNRGGCVHQEHGGCALCVAGMGRWMHVPAWEGAGRWTLDPCGRCGKSCSLTLLSVRFAWQVWGTVAIRGGAHVDSRGRRGESYMQRALRVVGVGNGATQRVAGHRFAWQSLCEKSAVCAQTW